jgi:hypothetical protein
MICSKTVVLHQYCLTKKSEKRVRPIDHRKSLEDSSKRSGKATAIFLAAEI